MSAYNKALAGESISDDMKKKWNTETEVFDGLTHDELERYARTIAYKVVYNLSNGHVMDPDMDPLKY